MTSKYLSLSSAFHNVFYAESYCLTCENLSYFIKRNHCMNIARLDM